MQAVVIADVDAFARLALIANHAGVIAELSRLALDLLGDGEWRQRERHAVAGLAGVLGVFQLHERLAEPGVEKQSAAARFEQKGNAVLLEVEQMRRQRWRRR